jgi:nucleoside-diphosphate-sugar epimerase
VISSLMSKSDIIIPLAGLVGAPLCQSRPQEAEAVNLIAQKNLIQLKSKSQIMIMPTTNSAYGKGGDQHFCNELSPLHPVSTYALHKVEIEQYLIEKENTVSLRLATVFGMSPRMRLDLMVNHFVFKAITDKSIILFEGHFRRNFIHILDVVMTFFHVLSNFRELKNQIYNVGLSSANLTKLELCHKIKEIMPEFYIHQAALGKDPDQRDYIVSNEKLEATGWRPKQTLEMGLNQLFRGIPLLKLNNLSNYG